MAINRYKIVEAKSLSGVTPPVGYWYLSTLVEFYDGDTHVHTNQFISQVKVLNRTSAEVRQEIQTHITNYVARANSRQNLPMDDSDPNVATNDTDTLGAMGMLSDLLDVTVVL